MKKMYFWMLALLMVGGMACVSCDDDDDKKEEGGGSQDELVGVWALTDNPIPVENDDEYYKGKTRVSIAFDDATHEEDYMIICEDGSFYGLSVYFKKDGSEMKYLTFEMAEGTYTVKNGKMTIKYLDDEESPENVSYSLKKGKLTITDEEGEATTFKRVDESKVNQYMEQYETDEDAKQFLLKGVWADVDNPYQDEYGNYWRSYYTYDKDGTFLDYEFYFGSENLTCKSGSRYKGYWDIVGGIYYEFWSHYDDYGNFEGYEAWPYRYYYYTDEDTGKNYFVLEDGEDTYTYVQTTQAAIDPFLKYLTSETPQRRSFAPRRK